MHYSYSARRQACRVGVPHAEVDRVPSVVALVSAGRPIGFLDFHEVSAIMSLVPLSSGRSRRLVRLSWLAVALAFGACSPSETGAIPKLGLSRDEVSKKQQNPFGEDAKGKTKGASAPKR